MNGNTLYIVSIRYFCTLLIMLLLSGLWMFILHTSLSPDGVMEYYAKKSFFGLLETVSPHVFAMGVVFFILAHFLAIFQGVKQKSAFKLSVLLFGAMIVSNLSGFFIDDLMGFFTVLKLISTILFIICAFLVMFQLYKKAQR